MPAQELFAKAYRLLRSEGRIEYLEGGLYNVKGEHGTYLVRVLEDERVVCNCKGFQKRKMCSHALAIILRRARKEMT
jgi:hypothetical protein